MTSIIWFMNNPTTMHGTRTSRRIFLLLSCLGVIVLLAVLLSAGPAPPSVWAQEDTGTPTPTASPSATATGTVTETATATPTATTISPVDADTVTGGTVTSATATPITATATPSTTIQPSTVSITATIWAKVTATAAAMQTLTPQATPTPSMTPTPSPTPGPDDLLDRRIDEIIAQMSVADRVGQLFIIDFLGSDVTAESDIAELIREYRIGGVVLSARNGNFSNSDPSAPRSLATLTNQLQALTYGVELPADQALTPPEALLRRPEALNLSLLQQGSVNLPLLIGAAQGGDGIPGTTMRSGFTTLPPQMALGATWDPTLVENVGAIVGRELAAVGVNLLLGPSLDVLDQPRPDSVGGLGLHTFGGDAYWVGALGGAYILGVHEGSAGRVATIARHFPGQGGSDRRPDEEVPTIQKSLQELRRIELPPFANVTKRASSILRHDGDPAATDGLMSGHIRYSSFQGSRERTPPISLAQEMSTILALEEFVTWRQGGGLVMSNALGVPSIRRYYDPALETFPGRRVALDAFLAGNDLLYLSRFSLDDDWNAAQNNIKETILFFRERYTSDPEFAARVDESLRRVLRLKLRLYMSAPGEDEVALAPIEKPELADVLVESRALRTLSGANRTDAETMVGQVAREALTILFPDPRGLAEPLPAPPQSDEKILIFTDSRLLQECDDCPTEPAIAPDAVEEAMLRLYGPDATGQLQPDQLTSLTFAQLNAVLKDTAPPNEAAAVETAIAEADWLIFAMLDVDVAHYQSSDAVKQFLRLRSDRLRGKRMVVLAFNAPYFLDSTEISKLNAYLGLYSKTQPFIEAAVHAIFRAAPAPGAPPVSVPGTRYSNLIERLEPDPDQAIELHLLNEEIQGSEVQNGEGVVEGITADVSVGDLIEVETGVIRDRNGNPVPDGTQVEFRVIYEGEDLGMPIEPVPTQNGKARIAVPLERNGTLRISASSVDATNSAVILINTDDPSVVITPAEPTQIEISADEAAETEALRLADAGEANAEASQASGAAGATDAIELPTARVDLVTLALAFITQLVMLGLLLVVLVRVMPRGMLVYRLLWALAVGWLFYILYGLGLMPGGTWLQLILYPWGVIPVVFIGMLLPLVWLQLRAE